jgi:hypothetical protein
LLHQVGTSRQIVAVYRNVMNRQNVTKKDTSRWEKFDDDAEVREEVVTCFKGQAADFYDSGI